MSERSKLSSRFKKIEISTEPKKIKIPQLKAIEIAEPPVANFEADFKKALLEKIESIPVWFEYTKSRRQELVKSFVENKIAEDNVKISDIDKSLLIDNLFSSINDFGPIQYLIDNEKVTTVIVNGTKSIHIEIGGKILNTETKLTNEQLLFLIKTIGAMVECENFCGIKNFSVDGYSICVVADDVCENGVNITVRKKQEYDAKTLIKNKVLTKEMFDFLAFAIADRKNIVISGCINSGKTALLDALSKTALKDKRSFIIEREPQLSVDFNTMTKFKNSNPDLISYILKSMPDYLVADLNYIEPEFIDLRGFISTVRANSFEAAFQNLVGTCVVSGLPEKFAKAKVLSNFDYIVHLDRLSDGSVKVIAIMELVPAKTMQNSIKTVAKYVDGKYISEIPQPFTAMRSL